MRRRVRLAAAAAALATSLSLVSAAPVDEPADGLVFDAISAPAAISYTGTVEVVRIGDARSEASVYRIEHRAPNLTREDFTSPPSLAGDAVITHGRESFSIDARRHRVVESQNDAANDQIALDDNYILLRANYRAVKTSAESLDGRDVLAVDLVNNYTHRTIMTVRIDRDTKLVLDRQRFGPDGALASEVRFTEVRYVREVRASDFDLPKAYPVVKGPTFGEPHGDVDRVVRSAGFPARGPKSFPGGFAPVGAHLSRIKGVRTLHVMYSDGIRTVSLFENAGDSSIALARLRPATTDVAGRDAQYAEQGSTTLLAWNDGAIHYTLVGELNLVELQTIAASIAR